VSQSGDTFLGYDVNDFTSETVFGIFNDPDAPEFKDLQEAMKEILLDVPLYEGHMKDVLRAVRLQNEDRSLLSPPRAPAIVKKQTILKTKWEKIELGEE
jgi:hypothetical protein